MAKIKDPNGESNPLKDESNPADGESNPAVTTTAGKPPKAAAKPDVVPFGVTQGKQKKPIVYRHDRKVSDPPTE